MSDYLQKNVFPVGTRVKVIQASSDYYKREAVVVAPPSWASGESANNSLWIDFGNGNLIWGWRKGVLEVIVPPASYRYEVTAGTFRRTYEDEGKAIAVARAVRDYISSMIDPENHPNVILTKTPTVLTPEKVEF